MSTPAGDKEPSIENAAKQIAQSLSDVFSGLFDYEGHSNRDRNYWQKGPGPENTGTWKHKYERAIDARDAARRERDELQAYLELIRQPITESAERTAAQEWVRSYIAGEVDPDDALAGTRSIQALTTVLNDLKLWRDGFVEQLERNARVEDERDRVKAERDDAMALAANRVAEVRRLQTECKAVETERDRYKAEHANATRLLNEQSEAARKAAPKPVGLSEQLQRLDKVITDQIEAVGSGSTLAKAANIRRLQARDYDLGHDQKHGWSVLAQAAKALMARREENWPWDDTDRYRKLAALPLSERLAHAAALLCAAGDVAKAEGM